MPDSVKLRIENGPRAGEVLELRRGEVVTVGRSPEATISIEAPGLSRRHFELRWDGSNCMLRDLASRNGVLVNGLPVTEAVVAIGDRIQAADTRYTIEVSPTRRRIIEEGLPTADAAPAADAATGAEAATMIVPMALYEEVAPTLAHQKSVPQEGSLVARLIAACSPDADLRTYALIDGAQAFELAFTARLMGNRLYTLFSGALAVDLAHVGPCLVELAHPNAFLEKWVAAIGTHSGVLLQTRAELATLYAHLRKIFVVTDEENQEYFFRFYDPRVLRIFLPTCTPNELSEFFGPMASMISESEDSSAYHVYALSGDSLQTGSLSGSNQEK